MQYEFGSLVVTWQYVSQLLGAGGEGDEPVPWLAPEPLTAPTAVGTVPFPYCIRRLLPPGACSSPDTVTPSAVTSTDTPSAAVSKRTLCPGIRYAFWILSQASPSPNGTVTCVSQSSSDGLPALYRSASWTVFCSVAVLSGSRPPLLTITLLSTLVSLCIATTA